MLMIAAVIAAASCMQAAGGLEYMVKVAEHILRRNPAKVTILSPIVTYLFTFIAGTGHIAYSVLPVIAECSPVKQRFVLNVLWALRSLHRNRQLQPVRFRPLR